MLIIFDTFKIDNSVTDLQLFCVRMKLYLYSVRMYGYLRTDT